MDLETGEILATKDVCEEIDPPEMRWQEGLQEHTLHLCSILAARFKEHFPMCEGRVISITGDELKTGICRDDGLRKGMRLILYKNLSKKEDMAMVGEEDFSIVEEEDIAMDGKEDFSIVGEAMVKEVEKDYSLARLLKELKELKD